MYIYIYRVRSRVGQTTARYPRQLPQVGEIQCVVIIPRGSEELSRHLNSATRCDFVDFFSSLSSGRRSGIRERRERERPVGMMDFKNSQYKNKRHFRNNQSWCIILPIMLRSLLSLPCFVYVLCGAGH